MVRFAENGAWADLLNGPDFIGSVTVNVSNYTYEFTLEPNWRHIFFRQS